MQIAREIIEQLLDRDMRMAAPELVSIHLLAQLRSREARHQQFFGAEFFAGAFRERLRAIQAELLPFDLLSRRLRRHQQPFIRFRQFRPRRVVGVFALRFRLLDLMRREVERGFLLNDRFPRQKAAERVI